MACKLTRILTVYFVTLQLVVGWDLTILHTNDRHAHVEGMNKYGSKCLAKDKEAGKCFGGYARHATAIKKIREEEDNVILLSGGDWSSGTIWYSTFLGTVSAEMMTKLGYNAAAVGNHEFDRGIPNFVDHFLKNVNFPVLSANADLSQEPDIQPYISPSVELDVHGKKVGVIGYTTSQMDRISTLHGNINFTDEVAKVAEVARSMKNRGIEIIVAVGHSGSRTDKEIARRVPDVDVVVGGHDNVFLYTGTPPAREKPQGPYPIVVTQESGRNVLFVQDYMFGKYLGYLKVTFDDNGEAVSWTGNPILMNSTFKEDPEVLIQLKPFKAQVEKTQNTVIGESFSVMTVYRDSLSYCRERECTLGNMVADAMFDLGVKQWRDGDGWSDVNAAVWNSGSIRADLEKGNITIGDIMEIVPFGNLADSIELRGTTVKKMFEHSVSDVENNEGRFLQVSGFRVLYDMSRVVGQRVLSIGVLCRRCPEPRLEPLVDDKVYRIMLSSYIAGGGDGYAVLKEERVSHTPLGFLDADIIINYIKEKSPVYPVIEGRILMKNPFPNDETSGVASGISVSNLPTLVFSVIVLSLMSY